MLFTVAFVSDMVSRPSRGRLRRLVHEGILAKLYFRSLGSGTYNKRVDGSFESLFRRALLMRSSSPGSVIEKASHEQKRGAAEGLFSLCFLFDVLGFALESQLGRCRFRKSRLIRFDRHQGAN